MINDMKTCRQFARTAAIMFAAALVIFTAGYYERAAIADTLSLNSAASASSIIDQVTFGDPTSESSHAFTDNGSKVLIGGLGIAARQLQTSTTSTWSGGSIAFTLKVDPARQNYFTGRFWGGEANPDRLILYCEGKQVGYIHLGDVDLLDFGNDSDTPPYPGRFYYTTSPLPLSLTTGKTSLHFEIHSIGIIWAYGQTFDKFQKPMLVPTRGIYAAYTHTNGAFVPPASDRQGSYPANPPLRTAPGPEVVEALKARVEKEITKELAATNPLNQMQMEFLARAYNTTWTTAYKNPAVLTAVTAGLDQLYVSNSKSSALLTNDPSTPNPGWFGFGPAGHALWLLYPELQPILGAKIDDGNGGQILRKDAWTKLFTDSIAYSTTHRRQYSNQSMIVDLGISWANRALEDIAPVSALAADQVSHYLYQSLGLEPWLGSETGHGPAKPLGGNYWELTPAGLSKELGYVGYYGEVLDWVTQIYDSTRTSPAAPGDPKILEQLVRIARARAVFRYPGTDEDGDKAMIIETIIGWRDYHYPGNVIYSERSTWDASALYAPAATEDSHLVAYAQQMIQDHQLYDSIKTQMDAAGNLRVTAGLLNTPDELQEIQSLPPSSYRLPMTPGQPDFVFADTDDGVVAIKHGPTILYTSLYWRARYAINYLARVHCITPDYDRIAVVHDDEQFEPSGLTYTRPAGIGGTLPGGVHYPSDWTSAEAGETLPIAKIPDGANFKPGSESPYAGRASFYDLQYGRYLIGQNTTTDKSFTLAIPRGVKSAIDLATDKPANISAPISVGPGKTAALLLSE
jgi:hypothetical protein